MRIDDEISKFIVSNTDIFQNVSPNIITGIGLICNYFIFTNIYNNKYYNAVINPYIFALILSVRWLSDCLDGEVARKYKKTSKIGHYLDTASDMIFIAIIFYYFMIKYNLNYKNVILLYLLFIFVLFYLYDMVDTHDKLKDDKDGYDIFGQIIQFSTNNTLFIFTAFYIMVLFY
jgi:phosphatidylglycerophosphate synthase